MSIKDKARFDTSLIAIYMCLYINISTLTLNDLVLIVLEDFYYKVCRLRKVGCPTNLVEEFIKLPLCWQSG